MREESARGRQTAAGGGAGEGEASSACGGGGRRVRGSERGRARGARAGGGGGTRLVSSIESKRSVSLPSSSDMRLEARLLTPESGDPLLFVASSAHRVPAASSCCSLTLPERGRHEARRLPLRERSAKAGAAAALLLLAPPRLIGIIPKSTPSVAVRIGLV